MLIGTHRMAWVALVLAALVAGGCGAPPPPATRLKVSVQPYLSHAPLFIAVDDGHFAAQGLEVELIRLQTNKGGMAALAKGELDVTASYLSAAVFNGINRGARVQIVADKGHVPETGCTTDAFVARTALVTNGGLRDETNLRGMRIAFAPGTAEEYYVDRLLRRAGLTLADIRAVDLPTSAEVDALQKGTIDLTMTGEPALTAAVAAGAGVLWMPLDRAAPGFQQGVLLYGPNLLDRAPDVGRRFMAAYLSAVRQYNQGKTDRNVEILAQHTNLPPDVVRRACWAAIREDGRINSASLIEFQQWARDMGYLDRVAPVEALWNPSFSEAAVRVLGAAELKRP